METRNLLGASLLRWAVVAAATVAAVGWRMINADYGFAPNLELCTAATFLAVMLLGNRLMALVPIAVIVVTDAVIGNSSIALFTWTAWAVVGLGALLLPRIGRRNAVDSTPRGGGNTLGRENWRGLAVATGFGLGASVWFYLWTNFGVWLLGRGTWYPAGIDGLWASYVAGLPFFRTMLVGNLVFLPLAAGVVTLVRRVEVRGVAVAVDSRTTS